MRSSQGARPFGALAAVLLVGLACSGGIEGGSSSRPPSDDPSTGTKKPNPGGGKTPGGGGGGGTDPGGGMVITTPGVNAGAAPLRRLTADQYRNAVADLLGLDNAVTATALPADETLNDRFATNIVRPLQSADLDQYADVALDLAQKAVTKLGGLVPCDPARGDAACATQFIQGFGRRAYRRPLTDVENTRLQKLYQAGGTFTDGIRLVIAGVLQSPSFLYLVEPVPADGAPGAIVALDGWSVATRLSFFLWNTTPDEALLTAAGDGKLGDAEGVAAQATRLLQSPRFAQTAATFHGAWLGLTELAGADKDPKLFPMWNEELKTTMGAEVQHFVGYVLGAQGDGKLDTLLAARFSLLSGPLYDIYGVSKPAAAKPGDWQRADLKPGERAGLLTQPGLMAGLAKSDRTSFVRRGKMVREALFCADIPPPPPGVNDSDTTIPPTATARERAEIHRQRPDCKVCHEGFDPIGFAFENYDAVGRYRATDAMGKAIDASADVSGTDKLDGHVQSILDLLPRLGADAEVRGCVARQWMRFALGRNETVDDEPSLAAASKAFDAGGGKIADLLLALAKSDTFRHQKLR